MAEKIEDWEQLCGSCRGEEGHESGGPAGWVPAPCSCHPALVRIRRLEADLHAMKEGELADAKRQVAELKRILYGNERRGVSADEFG